MNGQACEPDAECVLFPTTGDLVGVSLAWKAGQLAMECNMRETTTQKLNALSIGIGAMFGAFVQVPSLHHGGRTASSSHSRWAVLF